jgi:hypothetical protein
VYEKSGLSNASLSSTGGSLPFPLAELALRGSGLVPDFRVFLLDVANNLSVLKVSSTDHNFLETLTFLGV